MRHGSRSQTMLYQGYWEGEDLLRNTGTSYLALRDTSESYMPVSPEGLTV